MVVMKFGGTSVGSAERMHEVLNIIKAQQGQKIVVLSAMSGTTNALVEICNALYANDKSQAQTLIEGLYAHYQTVASNLFVAGSATLQQATELIDSIFDLLKLIVENPFGGEEEKTILAQGELLSTQLFALLCQDEQQQAELLPALDFMRTDEKGEPFLERTKVLFQQVTKGQESTETFITQGYICRNHWEQIDNLQRGGSDYTATIIGAITGASEIQIWTDIDGVHNNDPRIVDHTYPIRQLSYREAAELAYFGAKILHPTCVLPAEKMQVPLRLKYTMKPDSPGTLISSADSQKPLTAIAAKDGITVVNIYSHRMLMAYGFMKRVFQVFEDHKTPIDMITTSEVAVSVSIDDCSRLDQILEDVGQFAEISSRSGYSIICIVGNEFYDDTRLVEKIFSSMRDIPIRMVSMGGSRYNISLLVKTEYKENTLKALNTVFES